MRRPNVPSRLRRSVRTQIRKRTARSLGIGRRLSNQPRAIVQMAADVLDHSEARLGLARVIPLVPADEPHGAFLHVRQSSDGVATLTAHQYERLRRSRGVFQGVPPSVVRWRRATEPTKLRTGDHERSMRTRQGLALNPRVAPARNLSRRLAQPTSPLCAQPPTSCRTSPPPSRSSRTSTGRTSSCRQTLAPWARSRRATSHRTASRPSSRNGCWPCYGCSRAGWR